LAEYKKHVIGEATKGITAGIVGALLLFFGQHWLNSDLEFKQLSRDAYLSTPLGQQGLTMAFDGKPLKNVSIVEFSIVNRTPKQVANSDLVFTVDDEKAPTLVSGGIIPPKGISAPEAIEELPSKDATAKKFRIKVVPKQRDSEYFHAVFVFEGDKAPPMSVSSASGDVAIVPYQEWKDKTVAIIVFLAIICLLVAAQFAFTTLVDYFWAPRKHKKQVERFVEHAAELHHEGKLKSADPESLADAGTIYASFMRPKPSKFWSKVLPEQRFEY
jgi:hypothetical protein